MNFFISAIVDMFTETYQKMDEMTLMSKEQKIWVKTQKVLFGIKPKIVKEEPKNARKYIYRLVNSNKFEIFIYLVIILNICMLAYDHHGISKDAKVL